MSAIAYPSLPVTSFRWNRMERAVVFRSNFGSQGLESATPLWEVELTGSPTNNEDARIAQVFLESINGYVNQIGLWNLELPAPAGTMRGTMTFSSSAAQGAVSIVITAGVGQAGTTLKKGDLLGFGSTITQQVVRVAADATANGSGVITVTLTTPVRNAFSGGAAITWDKPQALFRQKSLSPGIQFDGNGGQPWALSLIEDWRT